MRSQDNKVTSKVLDLLDSNYPQVRRESFEFLSANCKEEELVLLAEQRLRKGKDLKARLETIRALSELHAVGVLKHNDDPNINPSLPSALKENPEFRIFDAIYSARCALAELLEHYKGKVTYPTEDWWNNLEEISNKLIGTEQKLFDSWTSSERLIRIGVAVILLKPKSRQTIIQIAQALSLNEPNLEVQKEVLRLLGSHGTKIEEETIVTALIDKINFEKEDPSVKFLACMALGNALKNKPQALEALKKNLSHPKGKVRFGACIGIRRLTYQYTATLNIGHGFAIRDRQIKEVDYGRLPG